MDWGEEWIPPAGPPNILGVFNHPDNENLDYRTDEPEVWLDPLTTLGEDDVLINVHDGLSYKLFEQLPSRRGLAVWRLHVVSP